MSRSARLACLGLVFWAGACESSGATHGADASRDATRADAAVDARDTAAAHDASLDRHHVHDVAPEAAAHDGATTDAHDARATHDTGTAPDAGCMPECPAGLTCCGGACINALNDIDHCGACSHACTGAHPYCHEAFCATPACEGGPCDAGDLCCGAQCCAAGTLCCDLPSGIEVVPQCTAPVNGTCPQGCPLCP